MNSLSKKNPSEMISSIEDIIKCYICLCKIQDACMCPYCKTFTKMVERKKESVPFVECVYKRVAYKHIQNVKKEKNTLDNQINQHLTI